MNPTPQEALSAEQMLAALIEAQVKGGYMDYEFMLGNIAKMDSVTQPYIWIWEDGKQQSWHPLDILLSSHGLRAAYGEKVSVEDAERITGGSFFLIGVNPMWKIAAFLMLDSWLSGGAEAAIKTAYDLLPHA